MARQAGGEVGHVSLSLPSDSEFDSSSLESSLASAYLSGQVDQKSLRRHCIRACMLHAAHALPHTESDRWHCCMRTLPAPWGGTRGLTTHTQHLGCAKVVRCTPARRRCAERAGPACGHRGAPGSKGSVEAAEGGGCTLCRFASSSARAASSRSSRGAESLRCTAPDRT